MIDDNEMPQINSNLVVNKFNMLTLNPQFITDKKGKKVSVIFSIKEYNKLLEEIEDIEDIKLYDEAKSRKNEFIPIDEAFKQIKAKRKRNGL